MNNRLLCNLILSVCILSACAGKDTATRAPTQAGKMPTPTLAAPTLMPSETPSPAPTILMTPTITPTLTPPPENFALADSGFDIADVRVSNLQADTVHVQFKYQIDRNYVLPPDQKLFIMLMIPANCKDKHTNDPKYYFEDTLGTGSFVYKQNSTSRCSLPFFDITIDVIDKADDTNVHFKELYRERIRQPLEVAGNSMVIDASNLTVKNIEFQATGPWSGQLTFDYEFVSDISLPSERYRFLLNAGAIVRSCGLLAAGPSLNRREGRYMIEINSSSASDPACLETRERFSYEGATIELEDTLTTVRPFSHAIGFTLTLRKEP